VPVAIIRLSENIKNTSRQSQKFSNMPNPPKPALSVLMGSKYLINNFIFEGMIKIVKNFHGGMNV